MSAHYAMCKYDDATGSYIPLEVRPITDKLKKDDPLYQEGFQAGAASRDAEIDDLGDSLAQIKLKNDLLIAERDQLRAELEAAKAEIAHWKNNHATEVRRARILKERTDMPIERVTAYEQWGKDQRQLAAEQAKNVWLREALINLMKYNPRTRYVGGVEFGYEKPVGECLLKALDRCDNALATPSDTSALEAIVKKAGEVMRERCAQSADDNCHFATCDSIQLLPGVTLEDLK